MKVSRYTGPDPKPITGRMPSPESAILVEALKTAVATGDAQEISELTDEERKKFANRLRSFATSLGLWVSVKATSDGSLIVRARPKGASEPEELEEPEEVLEIVATPRPRTRKR